MKWEKDKEERSQFYAEGNVWFLTLLLHSLALLPNGGRITKGSRNAMKSNSVLASRIHSIIVTNA